MTTGDPVKQIRDLRRLLDLYREGFPILKELVQNAEDAQASCLDYGWLEGLSQAEHPLLKSPALFFINNGKFDKVDARSLFYFDVSGKSDQEGTIGKFGLGLKSVFHLCEAFFYLAPSLPAGSKPSCNIFNPWERSGYHDDWDKFKEEDQKIIQKHLQSFLKQPEYQSGKWFIVWIPLRQKAHQTIQEKDENGTHLGTIKTEFFEKFEVPEFLQKDKYFDQISSLLSNLHNLQIIRYWQDGKIKYQAQSNYDSNYSRLQLKELEEVLGIQKLFKGKFEIIKYDIEKQDITTENYYFGNEIILNQQELIDILQHEKLKLENTAKIKAHCAVIFTRNCHKLGEKSSLTLRLATFLPVPIHGDEKDEIKIDCSSKHSYHLTLHGYFFINYARTKIIGWEYANLRVKEIQVQVDREKSREELETEWNFILYNYLLSHLLESLSQFADQYSLPPSEIQAICQSLKSSELNLFNENNLSTIYRKYKYIYRITSNSETWELININERVLILPSIPELPSIPDWVWVVFTKLGELSNNVYFTLKEKPNLYSANTYNEWTSQEICDVIQSLTSKTETIFQNKKYIDYLSRFLQSSQKQLSDHKILDQIFQLVRIGISVNNHKDLEKSIQSLIDIISPSKRFTINCQYYIFQEISKLPLSILVIHKDFEPNGKPSSKELNVEDAKLILVCLIRLFDENENDDKKQNEIYKLIKEIIPHSKDSISDILKNNPRFPIQGESLKTRKSQFYHYQKITTSSNFFVSDGKDSDGKDKLAESHHQLKNEQKLSSLFSYWDENYVIDKILSCPNPHENCWIILDALDSLLSNNNNYDDPNLSAVAWLITTENKPISPANVIYHDELKKDIQYIFTEADNQHIESKYVGFLMINKEIKSKYPNVWEWLQKKLFINKIDDIIDKLEEIIKKLPNYGLGSFTHPNHLTIEDINKWIETKIFHHIDDKILPCWSLLKKIYPPQRKKILPSLQSSSLNPERFVAILNYLSEHFKGNDKDAIAVYNKYLQSACTDVETFRDSILPNIQLLNQKNEWKSPQKLCPNLDNSHDNISNLYLLNNEQAYILIELLEQSYKTCNKKNDRQANVEKEKSEIALVLKDYFRDWEKYIPSELIGGFLCFLSHRENQELEKLVQKYLVHRDLQITFERVLPRSSRDRKFQIKVNQTRSGNLVEVISITGKPFQAEINNENDYKNLITKTPQYNKNTGVLEITFVSKPNIDNLSAAKLIELLKESTKWIIIHVYQNGEETTKKEIDNLFDDLDKSEQLPIQVAKNVLLNDLRQTLKRLRVDHEDIKIKLNEWNKLITKRAELENLGKEVGNVEQEIKKLAQNLLVLINEEESVKSAILDSVRKTIESYDYQPKSIPFEIFQNADDALVELEEITQGQPIESHRLQFALQINQSNLSFMHWGRPINYIGIENPEKYKDRGFHEDLQKMLAFDLSDKGSNVTGMFGLGFKSVHLISNKCYILSKRLAFMVVAGLLPDQLSDTDKEILENQIKQSNSNTDDGTIIQLEIDPKRKKEIIESFLESVSIMLIFARKIKECRLELDIFDNFQKIISWKGSSFIDKITIGKIDLCEIIESSISWITKTVICFEIEDNAKLLILIEENNQELKSVVLPNISTIWVTAPTQAKLNLGFIINATFDLTTGRDNLANSEKNINIADQLGIKLSNLLCKLYDNITSNEDWDRFKKMVGINNEVDKYKFWDFIWKVLVLDWLKLNYTSSPVEIIKKMFSGNRGMGYLITQCPSLPNGLWGNHRQLVCVNQVRYLVTGILAKQPYFEKVSTWTNFNRQYKPDQMILESVWENVKKLLGDDLQQHHHQTITLIDVLKAEIPNQEVTPEKAEYLGKLITSDFLQQIVNEDEYKKIKEFLQEIEFLSKANQYKSTNQLLSEESTNPEEKAIAGFAEDDRVLHPTKYQETGLEFFYACRQNINILNFVSDADQINWAEKAKNKPEKTKALKSYFDKEESKEQVKNHMKEVSGLSSQTQSQNLRKNKPIQLNPQEILEKIYQWWQKEGDRYIKKYEQNTYPQGVFPKISKDDDLKDQKLREQWMILFVLGATYTIGRTIPGHHRVFIETCQNSGWWKIFSSLNPNNNSEDWINILDQYFDSKVDQMPYLHWLSRYPVIYLFDRYLYEYVNVFYSINNQNSEFSLKSFLNTKSSQIYQGTNINLPPLSQILGIGANFMVRELVRKTIIINRFNHYHCFVAPQRVRKLFTEELRCNLNNEADIQNSVEIYNFLVGHLGQDKANFNLTFDLPFLTIADNKDLQKRFFGHEVNVFEQE